MDFEPESGESGDDGFSPASSVRMSIRRANKARFDPEILGRIVSRREVFKWLPVCYITDMEQGALYVSHPSINIE